MILYIYTFPVNFFDFFFIGLGFSFIIMMGEVYIDKIFVEDLVVVKLDTLQPHSDNPRKISKKAFEQLKESISRDPEYMVTRPIVVRKGIVLGGNQRLKACLALGMTEVPDNWIKRVDDWDDKKANRFVLLDNSPAGVAGEWDLDLLAKWEKEFDLGGLDFDDLGLDTLADDENELDIIDVDYSGLKLPVILNLTQEQRDEWEKIKASKKVKDDTACFLKIIRAMKND